MGPPHIAIFTHVKYSPLASSVRVIYVAFAVIQHQIFSHSLIKQIQVLKSNNSLNSINCSLSVRLNRSQVAFIFGVYG